MQLEDMLVRVTLAFLVGGVLGLERERQDRPAGLRTHMVVCGGSALITVVSLSMAEAGDAGGFRADPARVAAQIVSGIGFLGAGTIFRFGASVRGLTTAAGLWAAAAIGMALALGGHLIFVGLYSAVLIALCNLFLRQWEERSLRQRVFLIATTEPGMEALTRLLKSLDAAKVEVFEVHWMSRGEEAPDQAIYRIEIHAPPPLDRRALAATLESEPGVRSITLS